MYPAHGAGSVCGSKLAKREFSTLGFERRHNPMLVLDRDAFVARKTAEHHYKPPWFDRMHDLNGASPPALPRLPDAPALGVDEFDGLQKAGAVVVDTRNPEGFAGAHVPASLSIPLGQLPAFAGWLLPYDRRILLVVDEVVEVERAVRILARLGYDAVAGWLGGGMEAWETSGRDVLAPGAATAVELKRIAGDGSATILDVRGIDEYEESHLESARHIYVGELPLRLQDVPCDRPIVTICSSGMRASTAASILLANRFTGVRACLGPMKACEAIGCPTVSG